MLRLPRGADASILGGPGRVVPDVPVASNLPLQSDPRAVSTALEQANRLVGEDKHDDALRTLDTALAAQPRDPQLRFLYGVILADRHRTADATGVFEQLAADFPELPEPHNNLAVMHAAAGDLDKARASLENAVRALPGYALAHENLGDLYLRLAARSYQRATDLDAQAPSPRHKLAMARELIARLTPGGAAPKPQSPRTD
ncbi:MAG: tetratricopeptide repeat protein [Burkholderiaceae bacterium]|nr:tetratricopeptide repeat protein [Burkholderiaceae bacterium]